MWSSLLIWTSMCTRVGDRKVTDGEGTSILSCETRTFTSLPTQTAPLTDYEASHPALEALEQYTHPPQLELVYLKEGSAYRVAYQDRMDVLHLVEGLSASAVEDHLTYNAALERCTGAARSSSSS